QGSGGSRSDNKAPKDRDPDEANGDKDRSEKDKGDQDKGGKGGPKKDKDKGDKDKPNKDKDKQGQVVKPPKDKFARAKESVAFLPCWRESGRGFLAGDGLLLTTAPLLRATPLDKVKVYFPSAGEAGQKPLKVRLLYADKKRDLAILSVPAKLPPIPLAAKFRFKLDEAVKVVGNPGDKDGELADNTITPGEMYARVIGPEESFDQLRISLKPASAGGPVLNAQGEVIGMVIRRGPKQVGRALSVSWQDLEKA